MLPETFTPDYLRRLELLRIEARRSFLGLRQGGHISLKRGHGIEFSDYRKYELGDDPRHIDWGVYARSDRLYVKRFQEEQELTVLIIVDPTASMNTPQNERKWETARDLALSLAYVALMQQDTVVLSAPGHFTSPGSYGGRAIHNLGTELMKVVPGKEVDFVTESLAVVSRVRFPGVVVLISDFLFELHDTRKICNSLRAKNFDVNAVQILSPSDREPFKSKQAVVAIDSESGEQVELALNSEIRKDYAFLLNEHIRELNEYFSGAGIRHSTTYTDGQLADFILNNLARTGLLN